MPRASKGRKKKSRGKRPDVAFSWRKEKMWQLEDNLQLQLDASYRDPAYMRTKMLRFKAGDTVLSIHDLLYYSATIRTYKGLAVPLTIHDKGTKLSKLPPDMRVATVELHFEGWKATYDCDVPENELLCTEFPGRPVDTLGLLVAHEWNLLRRDQLKIRDEQLGASAFLMTDRTYKSVEKAWQTDTGETMSFGQFCGRLPGPYYSGP